MRSRAHSPVPIAICAIVVVIMLSLWVAPGAALAPGFSSPLPSPTATVTPRATPTPTPTPTRSTPAAVDICQLCQPPVATAMLDLNVRSGPGVAYPILGVLRAGQSAEVSGISADGNWLQIAYARTASGSGWVARRYVIVSGDLSAVPVVPAPPLPTPSPTPTATSTPTPLPAAEAFVGWRGEYYDNFYLQGPPVLVRDDEEINFNWADRTPAPGMPADNFSVRWTRTLDFRGGKYIFTIEVDDGVRLWVDDRLVIDEWHETRPTTYRAEVELSAGAHQVRLEYYEHLANALVHLTWHRPQDWKARYYANRKLQGDPVLERWEEELEHDWGSGSPHPSVPADNFSARYISQVTFKEGTYVFTVEADDGARLWVDGELLIDNWQEGVRTLRAEKWFGYKGERQVRVEYFERWGNAHIHVRWERR
ncbi:MAG: PA14 domain-containing protein [Anaerolineae bacterium]